MLGLKLNHVSKGGPGVFIREMFWEAFLSEMSQLFDQWRNELIYNKAPVPVYLCISYK